MNLFRSRSTKSVLLVLSLSGPLAARAAQPAAAADATTPSSVMRPALESLRSALLTLRPERWKASAQVTGESTSDVSSIERDLDTTLPPLLSTADAAPASASQLLPAYRNVEALYDVVVRVTQTAVLAAPPQQSAALQQATAALQKSRRDFGDLLDAAAQSGDRALRDTQARLRTIQATPPPPAPVCPTPPPPPVKKAKPRPKPKPAANTTTPATAPPTH
jgi:hypothetical protein